MLFGTIVQQVDALNDISKDQCWIPSLVRMTTRLVDIELTKIENPQTMIRKTKTIRVTLFAFMTSSFLVYSGCSPTADQEYTGLGNVTANIATANIATANNITAELKTIAAASKVEARAEEPGSEPELISGDLGAVDWSSMVDKEITVKGNLVVVDTFDLARRGQIKVARDRLYVPTNRIDPNDADPEGTSFEGGSNVAKVVKAQKQNDTATIMLDDGLNEQNIFPPTLFPGLGTKHPTVRIGSTLNGVSGKLVKEGRKIFLLPTEPLKFAPAQRPQRPEVGKADLVISSFNVLNYFTTIDNGKNRARGADSKSEFKRQEAKIVSAIIALQADVIGLMELENNLEAERRLVKALNKKIGSDVFKGCGLPEGFRETLGGQNAIRVGIIYRSDRVEAVGEVAMIRDVAFDEARTPLVQTFQAKAREKQVSVIVNHFKSKGGAKGADVANKNKGDGQGAYNATRRAQSLAVCNYIDELKQSDPEARVLVVGDLNAYGQEDPIDAMRAKGLVDLHARFDKQSSQTDSSDSSDSSTAQEHYSFNFRGQSGSLDHAMATESLAADVTGIATWHINADEPRFLDYNEEYNPKKLFESNPFRSSDHDPVLIGIRN